MAGPIMSPDTAKRLFDSGNIGQGTYDNIIATQPPPAAPVAPVPAIPESIAAPAIDPSIPTMPLPPPAPVAQPVGFSPQDEQMQYMNTALSGANAAVAPYEKGLQTQEDLIKRSLSAAQQKGREEAATLAGYQDEAAKIERSRMEIEAEAQKKADMARVDMEKKIAEFGSEKVDPERFYKNRTTSQKIMAAIGIALGGLGKGPNQALQAVNDAVDRDIADQRNQIGQKMQGAQLARTAYQDFLTQAKDEKVATLNMKLAAFENTKMKLAQAAAKYQGTQAGLNAEQTLAQLDLQKQALQNQRDQMLVRASYGMPGNNAKPMDVITNVIPEKFQKDAIKELGDANSYSSFRNELLNTYERLNNIGVVEGSLPGWIGGSAPSYEAENAKIAGAIIGKVPGIKSDADFKNIVLPMLPRPGDTPGEAQKKKAAFDGFLRQNAPATPILSNFGVVPDASPLKTAKPN